ncbi:permease [Clostridiisalibacter paucivorans]|uniref:permease n=1 Tax=Clostridiisalibacter paucivorans TaxID=408753 RepID=UPI00047CD47B|nr:permease [Clostridiisalibacter paucivorans]
MKKFDKNYLYFGVFLLFSLISWLIKFDLGIKVWDNFLVFAKDMVLILPPAFILIGLFDVWAKRESVEKHFGNNSNPLRFLWSVLLASTTVGGTFVAFPLANSMYHKGAKYSSIITYITSASLFMIPMSIMEASMLGIRFTVIRLIGSLPFIIIGAIMLEKYFEKSRYQLPLITDDK